MNNVAYGDSGLRSVSDLLQGITEPPNKIKRTHDIGISNLKGGFPTDNVSFNKQAIELSVPQSTNINQLYEFYTKLEGTFREHGDYGFISCTHRTVSRGTTFTVKLTPEKLGELLDDVRNIPEVHEVMEESEGGYVFPNQSQRFYVILAS